MKIFKNLLYFLVLTQLMSCINENDLDPPISDDEFVVEDEDLAGLNVSADFDYATSKTVSLELDVPNFLNNAVFTIYSKRDSQDSLLLGKAKFDANGHFENDFTLNSQMDSILLFTNYIGLVDNLRLPIENSSVQFDYRPLYERSGQSKNQILKPKRLATQSKMAADYTYIDTYDFLGVPDNLAFSDVIEQNLLDDINASLPEYVSGGIPVSHPEYLAGKETSVIVTKEADIWVTFVSEGAGYRNVLGYYSYPLGQEPSTVDDINSHNVIFPNTSMYWSGGGLIPGDRVYLGRFPENTVVSWFLAANGWNGSGVTDGNGVYYSNPDFNPESTEATRNHMVLLYDEVRELTLLGFEDLNRDGGSDDDFNDAVFYAKANPVDAIQVGNVAVIDTSNDADGDGVNDELDDFPFDPNQAFNNFAPAANSIGKLVFEDLWPNKGDYDFNDLELDYAFNLIANSNNLVTQINASFTISGIGGYLENGFGLVLPIDPSEISSIEGQELNADFISVNSNGTETNTAASESVIFVFGNALELNGQTIDITINLQNPIDESLLGDIPMNPFLVANGERAKEIHLPDLPPTSKGGFLGMADDFSDPSMNRYYKTSTNLPWALNIYDDFQVADERVPITLQYPRFVNWANSGGTQDLDWYEE